MLYYYLTLHHTTPHHNSFSFSFSHHTTLYYITLHLVLVLTSHHTTLIPHHTTLHYTTLSHTTPPSHTTPHNTTLHYHTAEQHILKSMGGDYDGDLYLLIGDPDIVTPLCAVQGVNFTGGRGAKTRSAKGVKIGVEKGLNVCVDNDDVINSESNGNNLPVLSSDSNTSNGSTKEDSGKSHKLNSIPTSTSTSCSTSVSSVASETTSLPPKPSSESSQECSLGAVVQPSEEHNSPQRTIFNFDFNFATCPSPEPGPSHMLKIPSKIPEVIQVLPNIENLKLSDKSSNDNNNNNKSIIIINGINSVSNVNDINHSNEMEANNKHYDRESNNHDRSKNSNNNNNNNFNRNTCAAPVPVSSYLQIPQGIPSRALNLLTTPPSQLTPSEFSEVRK